MRDQDFLEHKTLNCHFSDEIDIDKNSATSKSLHTTTTMADLKVAGTLEDSYNSVISKEKQTEQKQKQKTQLTDLPLELISQIITSCGICTAVVLGLTCKDFYAAMRTTLAIPNLPLLPYSCSSSIKHPCSNSIKHLTTFCKADTQLTSKYLNADYAVELWEVLKPWFGPDYVFVLTIGKFVKDADVRRTGCFEEKELCRCQVVTGSEGKFFWSLNRLADCMSCYNHHAWFCKRSVEGGMVRKTWWPAEIKDVDRQVAAGVEVVDLGDISGLKSRLVPQDGVSYLS